MALKIVVVGAGSREFGPATIRDILLSDPVNDEDLEIVLMDLNASAVATTHAYAEDISERLGRSPELSATTDLESALQHADFVITAIEIRRYFYWAQDFHIPRKYGFRQIYGENGGPGGLFHALRNMGPQLEIAEAMTGICPDAWLLNYTNPLTKLCEALTRHTEAKVIGLCHGVFQGMKQVAHFLNMDVADLDARASGLNHITWFHSLKHRRTGEDLYPLLRAVERKAHWLAEWDELALSRTLFRTYGLYPSPGANHIGEYIGWADEFLASSKLQFYYDPVDGHPWETDSVPTWIYNLNADPTATPLFPDIAPATISSGHDDEDDDRIKPSGELAIPIIEGMYCGVAQDLDAVNIRNEGAIPGLSEDSIVEVPAKVDEHGVHPERMPALPDSILGILRTQTVINRLLVDAYAEKSKRRLLQALLLDPCVHSYRRAVEMIDEMCELQREVLPELRW